MGQPSLDAAVAPLTALRAYEQAFLRVFGRPINATDVVRAIAAYERTQFSFDSPFDDFMAGDKTAISDSARYGSGIWSQAGSAQAISQLRSHTSRHRLEVMYSSPADSNLPAGGNSLLQVLAAESRNQKGASQGEHPKGHQNDGNVNGLVRYPLRCQRGPNYTHKEAQCSVDEV
jgi:cytochrome c peroxidase